MFVLRPILLVSLLPLIYGAEFNNRSDSDSQQEPSRTEESGAANEIGENSTMSRTMENVMRHSDTQIEDVLAADTESTRRCPFSGRSIPTNSGRCPFDHSTLPPGVIENVVAESMANLGIVKEESEQGAKKQTEKTKKKENKKLATSSSSSDSSSDSSESSSESSESSSDSSESSSGSSDSSSSSSSSENDKKNWKNFVKKLEKSKPEGYEGSFKKCPHYEKFKKEFEKKHS